MPESYRYKIKLLNILNNSIDLKEILNSDAGIEQKREKIRKWLVQVLEETYIENPEIPPLEYIMARNSISVFRKLIALRSEKLAGYSFLNYLDALVNPSKGNPIEQPTPGFFAELEHLIKGVLGKSGIYDEKTPAYTKYKGRRAANLRSADLSRMARISKKHMQKYNCGLDNDAIRRRSRNKTRILSHFNATELEWEKWQWHLRHIIRDGPKYCGKSIPGSRWSRRKRCRAR